MAKPVKFPCRMSVGFTQEQNEYLEELVRKKYFDNIGQAVRWFIDQFETHVLNLRKHGFDCVLPTMTELKEKV